MYLEGSLNKMSADVFTGHSAVISPGFELELSVPRDRRRGVGRSGFVFPFLEADCPTWRPSGVVAVET